MRLLLAVIGVLLVAWSEGGCPFAHRKQQNLNEALLEFLHEGVGAPVADPDPLAAMNLQVRANYDTTKRILLDQTVKTYPVILFVRLKLDTHGS
jgi:hypothetical protein